MVTLSPNFVLLNTLRKAAILAGTTFSYKQSTLFNTTINFLINISAIMIH